MVIVPNEITTNLPHTDVELAKIWLGTMTLGRIKIRRVKVTQHNDYACEQGRLIFDTGRIVNPHTGGQGTHMRYGEDYGTGFKKKRETGIRLFCFKIVVSGNDKSSLEQQGINLKTIKSAGRKVHAFCKTGLCWNLISGTA